MTSQTIRTGLLPLILLLALLPARAQTLSLDSCVALALRHNRQIEAARWMVQKQVHTRKALYANYFPNFNLQAVDFYSSAEGQVGMDIASPLSWALADKLQSLAPQLISDNVKQNLVNRWREQLNPLNPDIDFRARNTFYGGISVEQPLYMGGKITAGYRLGQAGERMARLGQTLAREEVIVQVHDAYQLLVKCRELHVVAQKYDSLLLRLAGDVQKAAEQGMASRNEKLKVQVKKNEAELKLRQAENAILLARMNLCQLVGVPLTTPLDVELPPEAWEVELPLDAEATPLGRTEARLLDVQVEMARQQVRLEQSARLPQVGMALQVGLLDGMEMLDQRLFRHDATASVMVSLRMPLYHAGEVHHKVQAAKADLQRRRVEQQEKLEKMELELQQQANLLEEAQLEYRLRQRHLEQCAENLRVSRKSYDVGLEPLSDLLSAQVLWQQAYADRAEAAYQLKSRLMRWRKAAGRLEEAF